MKIEIFSPRLCRRWLDIMIERWADHKTQAQRRAYLLRRANLYRARLERAGATPAQIEAAMEELRHGVKRAMVKRRQIIDGQHQHRKEVEARIIRVKFRGSGRQVDASSDADGCSDAAG